MGFLDSAAQSIAATLIPKAGTTSASIKRKGAHDSYTDEKGSPTTYPLGGVTFDEFSRVRHASLFDWQEGTTKAGDLVAYVPAKGLSITPTPATDRLVVGSQSWAIIEVRQVKPGTVTAMYALLVRG